MIIPIRTLGDPVLKTPAKPVEHFDDALRRLVRGHARDDVRRARRGPGRAAGRASRCGCSCSTTARRARRSWRTPSCLIRDGEVVEEEGCLSIPGPFYPTHALREDRVSRAGPRGQPARDAGEGLLARIFQHETDHLEGTLFIDRLDDEGRKAVLAELRRDRAGSRRAARSDATTTGYSRVTAPIRVAFLGNDPGRSRRSSRLARTADVDVVLVVTNPPRPAGRGSKLTADRRRGRGATARAPARGAGDDTGRRGSWNGCVSCRPTCRSWWHTASCCRTRC